MTATPSDPLATQHDSTPDRNDQAPADALRLLEENRALRELLAAQVSAQLPRPPGVVRRLAWWLISAPGAALVHWRRLLGREDAPRITSKRVGWATLTVLYTLAIYGALVLLVVYWSTPNSERTGASAASPVRLPLQPLQPLPGLGQEHADTAPEDPRHAPEHESAPPTSPHTPSGPTAEAPSRHTDTPGTGTPSTATPPPAPVPAPVPTLRITEIPAEPRGGWLDALKAELQRCAGLSFFDRSDCAWAARRQYCEPNQGWGTVKECPARP